MKKKIILYVLILTLLISCTSLVKNITDSLSKGIYQQNDLDLLKEGGPSFLLIVESLIYSEPDNRDYLLTGIQLYSSYSNLFIKDPKRKKLFDDKIKKWSEQLLTTYPLYKKYKLTPNNQRELKEKYYKDFVKGIKKSDIPYIFWSMYTIALNAISNTDDPSGMMLLPKIIMVVEKIYQLDDKYYYGIPHLFFGIYYGAYPESFGGNLAKSKEEFEKALAISKNEMLLFKVMYAEYYYKSIWDKENYVRILQEVVSADVDKNPELRIMNILAKEQAEKLLKEVDFIF